MDLNLYLSSGDLRLDLHMDLGNDLSLGLTSTSTPADGGNDPQGPQPPPFTSIGSAPHENVFGSLPTPYSPSPGLSGDPYVTYHPSILYQSSAQTRVAPQTPAFSSDMIVRNESRSLFYGTLPAGQSMFGGGEVPVGFRLSSVNPFADAPAEEVVVAPLQAMQDRLIPGLTEIHSSTPGHDQGSRIRSLFELESDIRSHVRRNRFLYESPTLGGSSVSTPERQMCDAVSDRRAKAMGEERLNGDEFGNESISNGMEDKPRTNNFDCNICLDMAKEPVVTSCGHLYCWPCLYQWLHVHSVHKECPVCKGEVEGNVTPIYGRGSSGMETEERSDADVAMGLKIPPRPRGCRFESPRQQMQSPLSRTSTEGSAYSWRRFRNLARTDDVTWRLSRHLLRNTNERLDAIQNGIRRSRRLFRMSDNLNLSLNPDFVELLPTTYITHPQVHQDNSVDRVGASIFESVYQERPSMPQRENAANNFSGGGRSSALIASLVQPESREFPVTGNPQNTMESVTRPPAADHASASSTLALIQDDVGATDASVEPNSAGSSRLVRGREWTEASGSQHIDVEGFPPARKRRRLN